MKAALLLSAVFLAATVSAKLSRTYTYSAVLYDREDGRYELYWNFDREAETIEFAVRASTTGWVGFGLSPNGGMIGSDVVIGWVDDDSGEAFLHVS